MSKTVWKFTLQWDTVLDLPEGARVLRVNEQEGCVCLWALVDPQSRSVQMSKYTRYCRWLINS